MKTLRQHVVEEGMRAYRAVISRKKPRFHEELEVMALDRGDAVNRLMQVFWQMKQRRTDCADLGNVHDVMVVADPYGEVDYNEDTFHCAQKINRLLPDDVIERLLRESNGELIQNSNISGAVKRRKRRRLGSRGTIVDGIKELNGRFYFHKLITSQVSENDVILQPRQYEDIPLDAKKWATAKAEVKRRNLRSPAAPAPTKTKQAVAKPIKPGRVSSRSKVVTVVTDNEASLDDPAFERKLLELREARIVGARIGGRDSQTGMASKHFSDDMGDDW